MIGLEICLPLLLGLVRNGSVPLMRLLFALTVGPAKVVGLPVPQLKEGARADLALIDPEARFRVGRDTLVSKSQNTPFMGVEVQGTVDLTMVAGRVVFTREVT